MRRGIQETDKSFVFFTSILKNPVTVTLAVGWIWIEETAKISRWFGFGTKIKKTRLTLTVEDARNLIAAIQELIPPEETSKAECTREAVGQDGGER